MFLLPSSAIARYFPALALAVVLVAISQVASADVIQNALNAIEAFDKAQKDAGKAIPTTHPTIRGLEEKLDRAARENADIQSSDSATQTQKNTAQTAEENARTNAEEFAAGSRTGADQARRYRDALELRRAARLTLQLALVELRKQLNSTEPLAPDRKKIETEIQKILRRLGLADASPQPESSSKLSISQLDPNFSGTGQSIGHIANLQITNPYSIEITISIPPMVLSSLGGESQPYSVNGGQVAQIAPGETQTIKLIGNCLIRILPPVEDGVGGQMIAQDTNGTVLNASEFEDLDQIHSRLMPSEDIRTITRVMRAIQISIEQLEEEGEYEGQVYSGEKLKNFLSLYAGWSHERISDTMETKPATAEHIADETKQQLEEHGVEMTEEVEEIVSKESKNLFSVVNLTIKRSNEILEQENDQPESDEFENDSSFVSPGTDSVIEIGDGPASPPTPNAPEKPNPPAEEDPVMNDDGPETEPNTEQPPVPSGLTDGRRLEIENLIGQLENPPEGVDTAAHPDGTSVEIPDENGHTIIVKKYRNPSGFFTRTHTIRYPATFSPQTDIFITVSEDYIEVTNNEGVRVYDRNTGDFLFGNPPADSDSYFDNEFRWKELKIQYDSEKISLEEFNHRLRARGLKWSPEQSMPLPFTPEELEEIRQERNVNREAREKWLNERRDADKETETEDEPASDPVWTDNAKTIEDETAPVTTKNADGGTTTTWFVTGELPRGRLRELGEIPTGKPSRRVTVTKTEDGDVTSEEVFQYEENGHTVTTTITDENHDQHTTTYHYDETGKLITVEYTEPGRFGDDGQIIPEKEIRITYARNADGWIESGIRWEGDEPTGHLEFDKDGNVTKGHGETDGIQWQRDSD